ncbi:aminoglycoside phosphotransferase family protein [Agromyces sp. S2-1-8]|uniref:aminoglycoside phosphotransferase family protein n=1 Tax=Agromyces sp. S2-1-8 TaxID=2897180 RepID=UPI001E34113E|nr:aminoglycoside phosphotransferase family protein [Agromyces sp. S2-1-8]MCD5345485.1 aminoglycoside phosphotransferase family protein [Agromyces sp. S2-1-8]
MTMDAPVPDFEVDTELAARLVQRQHPDLAGPLELVANGWDNAILRLGDVLAVRLPRRLVAVPLIAHEQRWLPELAARLPVAVPAPVRIGRPAPDLGFDAPWSIVPWFTGTVAAEASAARRAILAPALAGFVDAMAVPAPDGAPRNPYRGVPLSVRDEAVRARLDRFAVRAATGDLDGLDVAALRDLWSDALGAPAWHGPPSWLHGDLHPGNLVVEASGDLAAVIDFGDLTAGDPATDLATAWLTFGATGRAAFRSEVERRRQVDAATWRRARGWALVWGSAVVDELDGSGPIGRLGRFALAQVLVG